MKWLDFLRLGVTLKSLRLRVRFLTFGGYKYFVRGLDISRLGVKNPYFGGLDFLRLGVRFIRFGGYKFLR